MKIRLIVFAILSTIVLSNCKKEDKCVKYIQAYVISTNTPLTGEINKDIMIDVSFGCFNGCGQFGSFEEDKQGKTLTIKVIAKYEGCICTQNAPIRQTTYTFNTAEKGIYYLKFLENDNSYLTDTLIIQ